MTEQFRIEFLLHAGSVGIFFKPNDPDKSLFVSRGARPIAISVKLAPDSDELGTSKKLLWKAQAGSPATKEQVEFVDGLANRQFKQYGPNPLPLPHAAYGKEAIDAQGNISDGYFPPLKSYPSDLQELCLLVRKNLRATIERFISLLCWRQNIESPHNPIQYDALYWKHVGDTYPGISSPLRWR